MGIFCITRKQFLDRLMDMDELTAMTDMLASWYSSRTTNGVSGTWHCEARIYCFAHSERERILNSIQARLPGAGVDSSDPEELHIIGASTGAGQDPDLSVWNVILSDSSAENLCVLFRITFAGDVFGLGRKLSHGQSTIVLCGTPVSGQLLVKAIWHLGYDERMQSVYRAAAWRLEPQFVEALDAYLLNRREHRDDCAPAPAQLRRLLQTERQERKVMLLTRHIAELPDERGPAAFAVRFGGPLFAAIVCFAVIPFLGHGMPRLMVRLALLGPVMLGIAAWVAVKKLLQIRRYCNRMRGNMGKLYSLPIEFKPTNLSGDPSPTLLKCSTELEAMGAKHICDFSITAKQLVVDANRAYSLGDSTIMIGLLKKHENFAFFPAKPVIAISTRFRNGLRHNTVNQPMYRRWPKPEFTARCLLSEGGPADVFALHRRRVDRLIASGAVPLPAASSLDEVLKRLKEENEESREAWKKSPYGWGDAIHQAFRVCRSEYLAD